MQSLSTLITCAQGQKQCCSWLQDVVQVGTIQGGDTMQALLRLMSMLYAPQFITGNQWPESIKKDFIGMTIFYPHTSLTGLVYRRHLCSTVKSSSKAVLPFASPNC